MKLKYSLSDIIVKVDDSLVNGRSLTKLALEQMIEEFEKLPMDEKVKMIGSISIVNEDSDLSLNNVKIGQMVETVSDGQLGMIVKINPKKIIVKTKKGLLTGPPTAFKSTKKKAAPFIKTIKQSKFSKEYEGTFVEVFVKNEWHNGVTITNLNKSGKIKVQLYDKNSTVTLSSTQLNNENLVRIVNAD